jgi:integrase/recombinase XerD
MLFGRTKMSQVSVYHRNNANQFTKVGPRAQQQAEGTYHIRWRETNGKRRWLAVGPDLKQAAHTRSTYELRLMDTGRPRPVAPSTEPATLEKTVLEFIERREKAGRSTYRHALGEFLRCVGDKKLQNVTRLDLEKFEVWLLNRRAHDRTVDNKLTNVITFLREHKITDVVHHRKYTKKKVVSYRPDELHAMFNAAEDDDWLLFQFFLGSGARDQEVQTATWHDINFVEGIFTIRDHPEFDFTPKDAEEREVPLPDYLLAALKERLLATKGDLIFPNGEGKPDGHLLRRLKALAQRAGLDPDDCILHKFRKSYATIQHRAGVEAVTIQHRLGHSDLKTTLCYIQEEEPRSVRSREQMNTSFGVYAQ